MDWKLDESLPIRSQLTERLISLIASSRYGPGDRIPSVRDLASDAGVNPNTMQRALCELEDMGLVVTNRTAGRCVTEDINIIDSFRKKRAKEQTEEFLKKMSALGLDRNEIKSLLKEALGEDEL